MGNNTTRSCLQLLENVFTLLLFTATRLLEILNIVLLQNFRPKIYLVEKPLQTIRLMKYVYSDCT